MSHTHIIQLKNLGMGKFKRIRKKIIYVRTEINKMEKTMENVHKMLAYC